MRRFKNILIEDLNPRLNVIVGANAYGKTSLLESLSLVTTLKSFRTSRLSEMIAEGATQASVSANLERPSASKVIFGIELSDQKLTKILKIDGNLITNKSKHPYLGGSVSFIPDDLYLVKGSAEARRYFLNELGLSLDPSYIKVLQKFERTLKQRNQLLRAMKNRAPGSASRIEEYGLWTGEFIEAAVPVYESRARFVQLLNEMLPKIYRDLFRVEEILTAIYDHQLRERLGERPDFRGALYERINQVQEGERAIGHTLVGPHRDDFLLQISGRDAKSFGSQGEIRGAVIALKISQLELSRKHRSFSPILLLDDIISELDDRRVKALVDYLSIYPGQLFVTTAEVAKVTTLHQQFSGFKLITLKPEFSGDFPSENRSERVSISL